MIKISDGKRKAARYRRRLRHKGFEFRPSGKGRSKGYFYTEDTSMESWAIRFAADHQLRCTSSTGKYSRSDNYRRRFLAENPGYRKDGIHYHCAYCGRKLRPETLEVDHIIPVHAAQSRLSCRLLVWMLRLSSVNDIRNLTASCHSCNRRKSDKAGLWILRGYIGKHYFFWRIVHGCAVLILLSLIYLCWRKVHS